MKTLSIKKVITFCCILCLCMLVSVPALAADNNLTTEQLEQKVAQGIEAYMISDNGEQTALEIESISVVKLPVPALYANLYNNVINDDIPVLYTANVKVKTGDSTYRKDGISAAASMTMTWIDGKGTNNSITNLSGYATIAAGTYKSATLCWGGDYSAPIDAPHRKSVGLTFDENIDYTSDAPYGTVQANYMVTIKQPGGTYEGTLNVKVKPGILD